MNSNQTEKDKDKHSGSFLSRGLLSGIMIFAVTGAFLALYATYLTFKLSVSGIVDPSECSFNDLFTCDTVLSTGYAKMFGVPVAWFGFMYFLWVFFVVSFAYINRKKQSGTAALDIIFFVTSVSVLFTFFKIYQLIMLGVICPVCVSMYVCIFAIFFFSMKALHVSFREILQVNIAYLKSIFRKSKPANADLMKETTNEAVSPPWRYWIIFLWLFAIGFLGLRYYENTVIKPDLSKVKIILAEHFKQEAIDISVNGAVSIGNKDAEISIIEFSDFECPACQLLAKNMKAILLEYGNRVNFHFMNYPLDISINPNLKAEIHKNAGLAAIAGICANEQGKFMEFHDVMFANQTKINREFLIQTAKELDLDMNKFNECLDSEGSKEIIKEQIAAGKTAGVSGTPFLFINGKRVKYWNSTEVIKAIIELELKKVEK